MKSPYVTSGWEDNSINGIDPMFTDAANCDFTLQAGSPLIGAGMDLSAYFTTDFTGATRTTWDIGAYAYGSAGPPSGGTATGGAMTATSVTVTP